MKWKFIQFLLVVMVFAGCSKNISTSSVGVVDLPVVVNYSANILNEANRTAVSKEELYTFVNSVVSSVAAEKGCSVVLNKTETVVFYDEDCDITAAVIAEINRRILISSKSGK